MGDLLGCLVSAFGAAAASDGCLAGSTETLLKLIDVIPKTVSLPRQERQHEKSP